MKLTVLQEAPELHTVHDEGVVRAVLISQVAIEGINPAQVADVTHDDKHNLKVNYSVLPAAHNGHRDQLCAALEAVFKSVLHHQPEWLPPRGRSL